MAGLQELRKRLRSVRSAGQLASAMRTAATAKYARIGRVRESFAPYAEACRDMARTVGAAPIRCRTEDVCERDCLVVLGGNRGMCGGFNAELMRFTDAELQKRGAPRILSCGRRVSAWLRERGLEFEELPIGDVPGYEETRALADRLIELYAGGEVSGVSVVYQSFRNMLTQEPAVVRLLPEESASDTRGASEPYCLPDRSAIGERLARTLIGARLYDIALENAAGAQAATIVAMRSACDNAATSAAELEVTINRHRQAEITSGVIETVSGSLHEGERP